MKLMIVAMSPTIIVAPSFLVHQTVIESTVKPIRSHSKGSPVIWKTIGENIAFSTPHSAADKAIIAISMVLNYPMPGSSIPPVIMEDQFVILYDLCFSRLCQVRSDSGVLMTLECMLALAGLREARLSIPLSARLFYRRAVQSLQNQPRSGASLICMPHHV